MRWGLGIEARRGEVSSGGFWCCTVWRGTHGVARLGAVLRALVRYGNAWCGMGFQARRDPVRYGVEMWGKARHGYYGMVVLSSVWLGTAI